MVFSFAASIGLIIHGVFFDLDLDQIKRLTLEGFLITFIVVLPTLFLLEWLFDLENKEEFEILEKKISSLKKK